ncbi:hypothetical protein AB205_0219350 [Aquarana catesbeiana]|uniref:Uncharacterized protein n=1 Tax=Aquarana catesbeiana TaxID=8400 RepID=A0A2G9R5K0_AQUCT|nr:hypothetical protein AB205_0219350 [Aquarana catesbeiana]
MLLAPPAGLRFTCMALFSGWIKYLLRWAPPITQSHLCLNWNWTFLDAMEPCMYLKDVCIRHILAKEGTIFFFYVYSLGASNT